jgi:hypothetical protein
MLGLFSLSIWWTFNVTEFQIYRHESFDRPIFVVCYRPSCPSCQGVPEMARHFAENLGNRSDLLVTTVNADEAGSIGFFRITGTPFMCLVLGPKRKYWPKVGEANEEVWDEFIREQTSPSLIEITNATEFENMRNNSLHGGSSFHLETPDHGLRIVQDLRNISRTHRIFGCSFTYHVNPNITTPQLTVYRSVSCSVNFENGGLIDSIIEFVDRFKFAAFHKYDMEEYLEAGNVVETLIYVAVIALDEQQNKVIDQISAETQCTGLITGYVTTRETKRKVLREHGLNFSDVPILVYRNPATHCFAFYKGSARFVRKTRFIEDARTGQICNATIYPPYEEPDTTEEPQKQEGVGPQVHSATGISGIGFTIVYFAVGLVIIGIARKARCSDTEKNIDE